MGHAAQHVQAQIPKQRMTFVSRILQQVRQRAALRGNSPGLEFIAPHFMVKNHDHADDERQYGNNRRESSIIVARRLACRAGPELRPQRPQGNADQGGHQHTNSEHK